MLPASPVGFQSPRYECNFIASKHNNSHEPAAAPALGAPSPPSPCQLLLSASQCTSWHIIQTEGQCNTTQRNVTHSVPVRAPPAASAAQPHRRERGTVRLTQIATQEARHRMQRRQRHTDRDRTAQADGVPLCASPPPPVGLVAVDASLSPIAGEQRCATLHPAIRRSERTSSSSGRKGGRCDATARTLGKGKTADNVNPCRAGAQEARETAMCT